MFEDFIVVLALNPKAFVILSEAKNLHFGGGTRPGFVVPLSQ